MCQQDRQHEGLRIPAEPPKRIRMSPEPTTPWESFLRLIGFGGRANKLALSRQAGTTPTEQADAAFAQVRREILGGVIV